MNEQKTTQPLLLDFSILNLLPQILEELQTIKDRLNEQKVSYTKQKEVMEYLGIKSSTTLINYRKDGTFQENIHYKLDGERVIYITDGIIDFKENFKKGNRKLRALTEDDLKTKNFLERLSA